MSVGFLDNPRYTSLGWQAALTYTTLNMLVGKLGTSGALETLDGFTRLGVERIAQITGLGITKQSEALRELHSSRLLRTRHDGVMVVNTAVFRGDRIPLSPSMRATVLLRDEYVCVQCGSQDRLEIDHIVAVAFGGDSTLENLQTLCMPCNRAKGPRRNAAPKASCAFGA